MGHPMPGAQPNPIKSSKIGIRSEEEKVEKDDIYSTNPSLLFVQPNEKKETNRFTDLK